MQRTTPTCQVDDLVREQVPSVAVKAALMELSEASAPSGAKAENEAIVIVTISEDTIKNAVLRYHREYDRYLKLSARVPRL